MTMDQAGLACAPEALGRRNQGALVVGHVEA
jgi:hypothetical protein